MDQFECMRSYIDGVLVAAPVGDIDLTAAPDLCKTLTAHLEEGPAAMIIRLDLVTFLDSTGISALIKAYRHACKQNVAFALAAPREPVRKVIDLTGIDRAIPTHDTLRTALAEARSEPRPESGGDRRR